MIELGGSNPRFVAFTRGGLLERLLMAPTMSNCIKVHVFEVKAGEGSSLAGSYVTDIPLLVPAYVSRE